MKRFASINITEHPKYIIHPDAEVKDTYYVNIDPVEIYHDLEKVVQCIPYILPFSERVLSKEEGEETRKKVFKKVLRLAGVRSNRALLARVQFVSIMEEKGIVTFTPTKREKKWNVSFLPEKRQAAPLADPEALLEALKKATASCRVEENTVKKRTLSDTFIFIKNGVATSSRVIDFEGGGYQKPKVLKAILSRYLNELVTFTSDEELRSAEKGEVTTRKLEIHAITPPNESQRAILKELEQKAHAKGVKVAYEDLSLYDCKIKEGEVVRTPKRKSRTRFWDLFKF